MAIAIAKAGINCNVSGNVVMAINGYVAMNDGNDKGNGNFVNIMAGQCGNSKWIGVAIVMAMTLC